MLPLLPVLLAVVALACATGVGVADMRRRQALRAYCASVGGTYCASEPALAGRWCWPRADEGQALPSASAHHVVRARVHGVTFTAFECVAERTGRAALDPRTRRASVVVVHVAGGGDVVTSRRGPLRPEVVRAALMAATGDPHGHPVSV